MAKQIPTPGRCLICDETFTKRTIIKHIQKMHHQESEEERFIILIDTPYSSPYWFVVIADKCSKLQDIDSELRDIWVECCGHLSCFNILGREYNTTWEGRAIADIDKTYSDTSSMNVMLHEVLEPGMKFSYEYDFGSTTELRLSVSGVISSCIGEGSVCIVAYNQKPEMVCDICGKSASFHNVEDESVICAECVDDPDNMVDESMLLPICNSPRTGVCGYEGGTFDSEEDEIEDME
jgi:hypothetical protein